MWTDRYQHAPTRELLGPEATVAARLQVLSEVAAVTPGAAPGLAAAIANLNPIDVLITARNVEPEFGHDVAALLAVVRASVGDDMVGFGLTSSNIVDTAQALQLRDLGSRLTLEAYEAARAIRAGDGPPKHYQASRTHGRAAEHGSLNAHWVVWADRIARAADDASRVRLPGQLAGPTGRYAVLPLDRAREALRGLRLQPVDDPWPDQAVSREYVARWAGSIATIATQCAHYATQIRLAASRGEAWEGNPASRYHGSSSMPHKRNPTRSERIVGLERVIRSMSHALDESIVWWDQRDLTASSVERIAVPTIAELTGYILAEVTDIARTTTWDEETLRRGGIPIAGPSTNERLWAGVVGGRRLEELYDELSPAHDRPGAHTIGPNADPTPKR